jgi:translation initiation factor 2 beta subunit (eIF-2beta)/eIF-5
MSKWIGWIVALVLVGVLGFVLMQSHKRDSRELARATVAEEEAEQLASEIKSRQVQLEETEDALKEARKERKEALEAAVAETPETTPANMMEDIVEALKGDNGGEKKGMGGFMEMFKGEQGEKMAAMSAKMSVNMMYSDLFGELALDAETEEAVQALLVDFQTNQMLKGLSMMGGDKDAKALAEEMEAAQEDMNKELASLLSQEEMELYEEYQEEMPARMLDKQYDMQLRQFAPGLSEEAHVLVKDVLVEEMTGLQPKPGAIPDKDAMQNMMGNMTESFDRALERLSPELSDDEYASVERFMNQQQQFMEMGQAMMGDMFGAAEDDKEETE